MSYQHSMTCLTQGIRAVSPEKWRGMDGIMAVYWQAEGQPGASAYYVSPDPRIVIFFNDVSHQIRMTNRETESSHYWRPMTKALYVPAGMPLWTDFLSYHSFAHLDLHLHKERVLRFIAASIGMSAARTALKSPVEKQSIAAIDTLAQLLVDEIANPQKHAVYAENLVGSILVNLIDLPFEEESQNHCRLTKVQLNRLYAFVDSQEDYKISVANMAEVVGLSESWFAKAFKDTVGSTPLQWHLSRRIGNAKHLLVKSEWTIAEIAAHLGFSDQAHLTKSFRQITGNTPASWRRLNLENQL